MKGLLFGGRGYFSSYCRTCPLTLMNCTTLMNHVLQADLDEAKSLAITTSQARPNPDESSDEVYSIRRRQQGPEDMEDWNKGRDAMQGLLVDLERMLNEDEAEEAQRRARREIRRMQRMSATRDDGMARISEACEESSALAAEPAPYFDLGRVDGGMEAIIEVACSKAGGYGQNGANDIVMVRAIGGGVDGGVAVLDRTVSRMAALRDQNRRMAALLRRLDRESSLLARMDALHRENSSLAAKYTAMQVVYIIAWDLPAQLIIDLCLPMPPMRRRSLRSSWSERCGVSLKRMLSLREL